MFTARYGLGICVVLEELTNTEVEILWMEVAVKKFVFHYLFGYRKQVNHEETSVYPSAFRSFSPNKVLCLIKHQAKFE